MRVISKSTYKGYTMTAYLYASGLVAVNVYDNKIIMHRVTTFFSLAKAIARAEEGIDRHLKGE